MVSFVRYTLEDGSEVLFESAESSLVELHGGRRRWPTVAGCRPGWSTCPPRPRRSRTRCGPRLAPDEVELKFGLKVSGEVNWWFFAKNQAEGTIEVTLRWAAGTGAGQSP